MAVCLILKIGAYLDPIINQIGVFIYLGFIIIMLYHAHRSKDNKDY